MRQLRPALLCLLLASLTLLLTGCPPASKHASPAAQKPAADPPVLPARGKLLDYDKLHLGMTNVDIAQVYNAPEGKGAGFQRVVQSFNDVQQHVVTFDTTDKGPERKLVLALLRDELYEIVDRRDGLSAQQAQDWHSALEQQYGPPASESVRGAQWNWGPENGVLLTFTQDNASEKYMSANVKLVFKPYEDAAYNYLADWQKAHPEFKGQ